MLYKCYINQKQFNNTFKHHDKSIQKYDSLIWLQNMWTKAKVAKYIIEFWKVKQEASDGIQ